MIMMPHDWPWSSLQLTGQADFWHPTGLSPADPLSRGLPEKISSRRFRRAQYRITR
jgi:hypothetical protein